MVINNWNFFNFIFNDAPEPWQIGFQDSAAPGFSGIVELHNTLFFYLIVIVIGVFWVIGSIVINFNNNKSAIMHKYLNHGKIVPVHKCYKLKNLNILNYTVLTANRTYSTLTSQSSDMENLTNFSYFPVKVYENVFQMKKDILKENKGKTGIYMWNNKLTEDIYIGQSVDISKRLKNYLNLSYINSRSSYIISKALLKYGYINFSFSILEYCNISDLNSREQYYFDKLNPQYNILKIAGSSKGYKHLEITKIKISNALKSKYIGDKSALYGKFHTEETKQKMSLKKSGINNPLYGKQHTDFTKDKMSLIALGRKHSEETKLKMSKVQGNPVNIYEKCSSEGFKLIGCFVSARRAAKFLDISGSTVIRYMQSGAIFKERYKFSSK